MLTYGTITGTFLAAVEGPVDEAPTYIPVAGEVRLIPATGVLLDPDEPDTVFPRVFVFELDETGAIPAGSTVPATDNEVINPTGWTYQVQFVFHRSDDGRRIRYDAFSIQVPGGEPTDLTLAAPVSESGGVITVRGPAGVGVPAGGTTGQLLAKASGTDFDTHWVSGGGGGGGVWGEITGNLEDQADLSEALAGKQPIGDYVDDDQLAAAIAGVTVESIGAATPGDISAAVAAITPASIGAQPAGDYVDDDELAAAIAGVTAASIGAYVKPGPGIPSTDMTTAVQTSLGKADSATQGGYVKPGSGIPATDLTVAAQASLAKADTALQSAVLSVVAGSNVMVDATDPAHPIVSSTGGGGGGANWGEIGGTLSDQTDLQAALDAKQDAGDYVTDDELATAIAGVTAASIGAYVKPGPGIPSTDMTSAVQTSLGKADTALQSAPVTSVNTKTGAVVLAAADVGAVPTTRTVAGHALSADVTLAKADVGLGNVDNTADTAKPVSTAQAAADAAVLGAAVQSLVAGTNVTVDATDPNHPIVSAAGGGGGAAWGGITGTLSDQTDLQDQLDSKADFSDLPVEGTTGHLVAVANSSGGMTDSGIDPDDLVTDDELASAIAAVTLASLGGVPTSRTVNGHALTGNVTVTAADVSAVPTTRTVNAKALSADVVLTAADVSAVPTTRTVAGHALSADVTLAKADVGLGSVDNTADTAKPVSTAQAAAILAATQAAVNAQTGTAYTLVAADAAKAVHMSNAAANTLTIPPNSSVAFPVGTIIEISQAAAGQTTIAAGSGVTLVSAGSLVKTRVQWSSVSIRKYATDSWLLVGDLA